MNKARLEELRKRVFVYYQVWDVKRSQDGFQEASPTGEMDADGKDLTALIDSALAEPSGEDIDRALDWILTGKYETQVGDHSYVADSRFHPDTSRFCNTIAQALRQYQKPTDEVVQRSIGWLEAEKESAQNNWERAGAEWRMEPGAQAQHDERMASFDLAIQALCQMRTEPCGWCKWTDKGYRIEYNLIDEDGNCCPDMDNVVVTGIATYCPNCGRKLEG